MAQRKGSIWRRLKHQAVRLILTLTIIAAAVVVLWWTQPPPFEGRAQVADGDTIEIGDQRIRLVGIDAPEYRQSCQVDGRAWPCGRDAARFLRRMVSGKTVLCRPEGTDRFGRVLAECYVGEVSLNRTMVLEGWALSFGEFRSEEGQAEAERKGIWRGTFQRPAGYRRDNPRVTNFSGAVWGNLRRWFSEQ